MKRVLSIAACLVAAGCVAGCAGGDAASPQPAASPVSSASPGAATGAAAAIWHPGVDASWQIQLRGTVDAKYAVDAYDIDAVDVPQATIDGLHAQGRRAICYFSAGSGESFRADYGRFAPADLGKQLAGYPDERWLDVRSANVRAIMSDRIAAAAAKRCDAVDPDNVDGYANDTGFPLTAADQLGFDTFLAGAAHASGMAVGLKNDLDQIPQLVSSFEFSVDEQCHEYAECDALAPFTQAGKPVFNIEYAAADVSNANGARDRLCAAARAARLRTLVLPLALDDSFRFACDG